MLRNLLIVFALVLGVILVLAVAAVVLVDPDDYRDDIAQRASAQLGREVTLAGPMSLRLFPWLAIEISDVGVANPPDFGEAPPLAHIGTATASVRVWPLFRGEVETGAIRLDDAELHLVTNPAGRSNLDGLLTAEPDPTRPEEVDLSHLRLGEVSLRNVAMINLDQRTGEQTQVLIESFSMDPFRVEQPIPFRLSARVSDADGELVRLSRVEGTVQVARDAGTIDVARLLAEFDLPDNGGSGSLRAAMTIDARPDTPVLVFPVLDVTLAVEAARLAFVAVEPLTVSLGETISAEIPAARIGLNEQQLDARGDARIDDQVHLNLAVSGEHLDLRPLLANGRADAPAADREVEVAGFEGLEGVNATFSLALQTLVVSDVLSLDDVEAQARLADNVLVLSPLNARLLGGRFDGRMEVDFSQTPARIVLQPRLEGIMVDRLAELSGAAAPVQGSGDLQLDLSFSGFDLAGILRSLDGSGSYSIQQGALLGVDLQRLVSEELTTANLANVSRVFGGQTAFESFGGSLVARSGIVELPDLSLVASDFGLTGIGQIDLPAGTVDYQLELAMGEALTSRLPRTLREATGGRVPLAIAGPIGEPTVQVNLGQIAERALRDQLEQRLLPRGERRAEELIDELADEEPPPEEARDDQADEPERRERSSDLLLRALRERRDRTEETEDVETDEAAEDEQDDNEDDEPPAES
ncbi:MAG: AsmA family protein [Wenzhouxiangella sp.]